MVSQLSDTLEHTQAPRHWASILDTLTKMKVKSEQKITYPCMNAFLHN